MNNFKGIESEIKLFFNARKPKIDESIYLGTDE